MATLLVPQQHVTLADAVTAASSGDIIALAPGEHIVASTISRSGRFNVRVISQDPNAAQGTVVQSSVTVFSGLTAQGWAFYDLTFRWSADWRVVSSHSNDSFYGCTFDQSNRATYSADSVVLSSAGHTNSRPVVFRACKFIGPSAPGVGSARAIYGSYSSSIASHLLVESCLFLRWNMQLSQHVRVFGTRAAGSSFVVRNNSFVGCERLNTATGYIASNSSFGAGAELVVANNLLEDASGLTGALRVDISLSDPGSGNVWQVRNNLRRYPGFTSGTVPTFATVGGSSAGIADNETSFSTEDWLREGSFRPVPGSPPTRGGHPAMRPRMDLLRQETDASGRGAVGSVHPHPRMHVKWQRVPMLGGFQVSVGGSPVALPSPTYQSFDSPSALALWLSRSIDTVEDVEVFYSQHGYYMVFATTETVSVTTSGTARALMGPVTTLVADEFYRTEEDANTLTLEQLLDEDVEGDENRAFTVSTTGVGRPIVQPFPEQARRHLYTFTAVSNRLDTERFVSVLDKFFSGREMRVWRALDNDEPRGLTNRLGYSDIVPEVVDPSTRYEWYGAHQSRHEHIISGVEVRE